MPFDTRLNRRSFLQSATLGTPALLLPDAAAGARRPNVILIMTDDQGFGDLSSNGNEYLRTPNLDRLASQGASFSRFTVSSVCAPTRASLLTGRYSLRCGVHGVTSGHETMRSNEVTIGRAMQGAGYRTALFGKWHLGENYPYVPHAMGFDSFIGFRLGHWNRYFDAPLERNGKPYPTDGYIADALTEEALRFINRHRGDPFFLYLAYNTPHSPYQVPDRFFTKFRKAGFDDTLACIYAMVENIDENVGRLMGALEGFKLARDTIVVFLCDNGPNGERYTAGLRGRKGSIYEGGTRSPLFVRWPGKIAPGRKIDTIAAHIDVYPTLLDLCRINPPKGPQVDGVSLAPLLFPSARPAPWPDRIIFSRNDHSAKPDSPFPGAARTQRFKMVNGTELYDLIADPGESKNIAAENPAELARLNEAYSNWFKSVSEGFQPGAPAIQVGHWPENPAMLPATQAKIEGPLRFRQRPVNGFANDFLTSWTSLEARASWNIDVQVDATYEVEIEYLCPAEDVGSKIRITAAGASTEAEVARATSMEPNALPHRAVNPLEAPDMRWAILRAGSLKLPKGPAELRLEAVAKPGERVFDVKTVLLRRQP